MSQSGAFGSGGGGNSHDLHVAKLIVNQTPLQGGNYLTIAAALTAAASGDTIFVMPGTYTENLTLKAGVNITAFTCDSGGSINFGTDTPHVKIIGKATATFAGTATLSGIWFQTNSDFALVVSGVAATTVTFKDCFFNGSNNSLISATSTGGTVNLLYCYGNLGTTGINYFALTSGSMINIHYSKLYNSGASTTANTLANAGAIQCYYSSIGNPFTSSNTAAFSGLWSEFITPSGSTPLTINGTGASYLFHSRVESGTGSAISVGTGATLPIYDTVVSSTNANVITGAGSVSLSNVIFTNTSSNVNTTTVAGAVNQLGAPAYKYVTTAISYPVLATDSIIGVTDNSATRTITMPNSGMTQGQRFTVKDQAGTAQSANNITVSGNGVNIDGSATYVINTNYGSVDLYWNGSNFFVI